MKKKYWESAWQGHSCLYVSGVSPLPLLAYKYRQIKANCAFRLMLKCAQSTTLEPVHPRCQSY